MTKFVYALATLALISSVAVAADSSSTTGSTQGSTPEGQQQTTGDTPAGKNADSAGQSGQTEQPTTSK